MLVRRVTPPSSFNSQGPTLDMVAVSHGKKLGCCIGNLWAELAQHENQNYCVRILIHFMVHGCKLLNNSFVHQTGTWVQHFLRAFTGQARPAVRVAEDPLRRHHEGEEARIAAASGRWAQESVRPACDSKDGRFLLCMLFYFAIM